jgi:Cu-Zn family superoxide dismutase
MKHSHLNLFLAIAIPAVLAAGCASGPMASGPAASAALAPKSGSSTTGTVRFTARGSDKVMVTVDISGLKPNAEHGFHVHEKGDCSAPDAMSAGGHFNPTGMQHGGAMGAHHAGDIQNLKTDAQGRVQGSFEISGLSVGSGANDVIGKAVVVHRDPDDYKSQPAGNSGPRIACGLIQKA